MSEPHETTARTQFVPRDNRLLDCCVSDLRDLPAGTPAESPEMALIHALEDCGATFQDLGKALETVSDHLDRAGASNTIYRGAEWVDELLVGVKSADDLGKRVMLVAFILETPNAAKNFERLALDLGLSESTARRMVADFDWRKTPVSLIKSAHGDGKDA